MAVGNPAKVVGYIEDEEPSLTMKHGIYAEILENHNFLLVIIGLFGGISDFYFLMDDRCRERLF